MKMETLELMYIWKVDSAVKLITWACSVVAVRVEGSG